MSDQQPPEQQEKVGFRDIYRAVGESEARVKEHISLVLMPISSQLAEHSQQLSNHEGRLVVLEATDANDVAEGRERRRIGDMSVRMLGVIVVVTNFILGLIIMFANLLSAHS